MASLRTHTIDMSPFPSVTSHHYNHWCVWRKEATATFFAELSLTLHTICVQRIRYFVKLSALASNQFVCPGVFISNYALNQFTNKASSKLPELQFSNYHFRSQDIAVDSICNVPFVSIETRLLHIAGKSTEHLIRSSWDGKNASCGNHERSSVCLSLI
jgi:hypothetical protein